MKKLLFAVLVCAGAVASAALSVSNYSWLQLAPSAVTSAVGGAALVPNYSAHGSIGDFRWGNFVWIPNLQLTGSGAAAYWGSVQFDRPRPVATVNVQTWQSGSEQMRRYYVDGYTTAGGWTNIGSKDYGSFQTNPYMAGSTVDVTDGTYEAIRVRFDPGDYTAGASYGGPGLYGIEPFGSDTLQDGERVNWAQEANFGTVRSYNITNPPHTDRRLGGNWTNGVLSDYNPYIGTNGSMVAGEYLQIDLGAVRRLDGVAAVGAGSNYLPASFNVQTSYDGVNFLPVAGIAATNFYPSAAGYRGALEYLFSDGPYARYVRLVDLAYYSGDTYWLVNQVMVLGTVVPEPAGLALLGLGGACALLRRRRAV